MVKRSKRKKKHKKTHGEFKIEVSDRLIVTDPMYGYAGDHEEYQAVLEASPGEWQCVTIEKDYGESGRRTSELACRRFPAADEPKAPAGDPTKWCEWEELESPLFVDAGMAGAWPLEEFARKQDAIWRWVIEVRPLPGKIGGGVAASSGMGDGSYPVEVCKSKYTGRATAVRVEFLPDPESDEWKEPEGAV